jgi:hypothetical protein
MPREGPPIGQFNERAAASLRASLRCERASSPTLMASMMADRAAQKKSSVGEADADDAGDDVALMLCRGCGASTPGR